MTKRVTNSSHWPLDPTPPLSFANGGHSSERPFWKPEATEATLEFYKAMKEESELPHTPQPPLSQCALIPDNHQGRARLCSILLKLSYRPHHPLPSKLLFLIFRLGLRNLPQASPERFNQPVSIYLLTWKKRHTSQKYTPSFSVKMEILF